MDYKIKFEYKGIGKQASGIRQKVLQAQKAQKKDGGASSGSKDVQVINSIKSLNSTIQKLISSNKELANSIKMGSRGGGIGGKNIGGGAGGGVGAGVGRMGGVGSSIPILGAAIAAVGFMAKKINDIGNAYISKTGEQIGSVGTGGFRWGKGVYNATQMGAGMKSYAMKRGKFSRGTKPEQTALDVGAIYGLSSQEVLGQAGLISRAGGSFTNIAREARGGGIETDLPALISGITGLMEEAIRNGINTSDMSKDIGKEMTALTAKTSGKSVDAALSIVRSFQGVKSQVSRGQIGTFEGMYATKASRNILMERLTGKDKDQYLERLQKEGSISEEQRKKISALGKNASFDELTRTIGSAGSFFLQKKASAEAGPGGLLRGTMKELQKTYGTSPEAMQRAMNVYAQQGGSLNQQQFRAAWQTSLSGEPVSKAFIGEGRIAKEAQKNVMGTVAGRSVMKQRGREDMLLKYGGQFAEASMKMEESMLHLAKNIMPTVSSGFQIAMDSVAKYAKMQNEMTEMMRKNKDAGPLDTLKLIMGFYTGK